MDSVCIVLSVVILESIWYCFLICRFIYIPESGTLDVMNPILKVFCFWVKFSSLIYSLSIIIILQPWFSYFKKVFCISFRYVDEYLLLKESSSHNVDVMITIFKAFWLLDSGGPSNELCVFHSATMIYSCYNVTWKISVYRYIWIFEREWFPTVWYAIQFWNLAFDWIKTPHSRCYLSCS